MKEKTLKLNQKLRKLYIKKYGFTKNIHKINIFKPVPLCISNPNVELKFITEKELMTNKDILITKADKGNLITIFNKKFYFEKTNELLTDNTTYTLLKDNPLPKLITLSNKLIKNRPYILKGFKRWELKIDAPFN